MQIPLGRTMSDRTQQSIPSDFKAIQAALADPFPSKEIGFKPIAVRGDSALALAYIDARSVMGRLDSVVGIENWKDEYDPIPEGVACHLSIRFGTEWVRKSDFGSFSDQKARGDQFKAAYSDALKRAAVKWGIGRYLYDLPRQWAPYDSQKKQFKSFPPLPEWARPRREIETVTATQVKEIEGLAKTTQADMVKLLANYHVQALSQLSLAQYDDAKSLLNRKFKAAAAKAANPPV